ncbi:MAG: Fur family transcriptional regulator [Chloroflexota bacterium]
MNESGLAGQLLAALRAAGYRLTADRVALIEYMARREKLVSVAELVEEAERFGVSRPTVFRLLDVLVGQRLAVRFTHEHSSRTFYTFCSPDHHHHVVCTGCGRVDVVETPYLERELPSISKATGYDLTSHNVELFGLCPACRAG